jgi:uncharacterized protein
MKKLSIALLTAALIATPAFAQDAAKKAALDRFMKATGADQAYQNIGQQTINAFAPLAQMNPTRQQEIVKIIEAEVIPELRAARPVFEGALRAAYSKRFSTAELTQVAAFWESPAGRKLRASEGEVLKEALGSLGPLQTKIQSTVAPRVMAKMRAAGMQVPPTGPAPKAK